MSVAKPMKEISVEEIIDKFNLIIPEIQREYVWGYNQDGVFETFLYDIKEGAEAEANDSEEVRSLQKMLERPGLDEDSKNSLISLLTKLQKPIPTMNVGFLYSYEPNYDRADDIYLIDGQQRFTTLFLILFYLSLKEDRKKDFAQLFRFDPAGDQIAFDYRVRSTTHQFIIDLIDKSTGVDDLLSIKEKGWFLANYANDTTIKAIAGIDENTGAFNLSHKVFQNDERLYYDFVKNNIKFWHFKTEETSQGEELYITMNSRGQQLADNETIRAKLFDDDSVRGNSLFWSEQWEVWQDFFWKHRNKRVVGVTADEGFNEFLRWVQILKMWQLLFKESTISSNNNRVFEKALQWPTGSKLDCNFLSLADIKLAFEALIYLFKEFNDAQIEFQEIYKQSHVDELIPNAWISTYGPPSDIIVLFQLLPVLHYCMRCLNSESVINNHTLYRLMRTVRTLSKDRTISRAVRNQVTNILFAVDKLNLGEDITTLLLHQDLSKTILNEELTAKLKLFLDSNERQRLEDLIWFAEDIAYNDGEILHLIKLTNNHSQLSKSFDISAFENVVAAYVECMANEEQITGNVLATDCYYNMWDRVDRRSTWYKSDGLLSLVQQRALKLEQPLFQFLIDRQKHFLLGYESPDLMFQERSPQKQLYFYYILSSNKILQEYLVWNWHECFHFGKLGSGSYVSTLFAEGSVFQLYKRAFHVNFDRVLGVHWLKNDQVFSRMKEWASS